MWKARIIWILWLIAVLCFVIFTDGTADMVLFIASIVVPVLCIIGNRFAARALTLTLTAEESAGKGQQIRGCIQSTNRSFFPCGRVLCQIQCENRLTGETFHHPLTFALAGKSKENLPFSFASRYCGEIRMSVRQVFVYDFWYLTRVRAKQTQNGCRVRVFPEGFAPLLSDSFQKSMNLEGTEYSTVRPGMDFGDTFAIRDYRPGDAPKTVHWKLTQKYDRLMVRDPGLPLETSYMLLLETGHPDGRTASPAACDCLTELFSSVIQAMAAEGIRHCVGWRDAGSGLLQQAQIQSEEDWSLLLPGLLGAGMQQDTQTSLELYLDGMDHDYATLLYFTPFLPEDVSMLTGYAGMVSVYLCSKEAVPEELYAPNIQVHIVSPKTYKEELAYFTL